MIILRLTRYLRTLSLVNYFKENKVSARIYGLSIVVDTLFSSMNDIVQTCLLLLVLYVFMAIVAVQSFGKFSVYFSKIQSSIGCFMIVTTLDGWIDLKNTIANQIYKTG